MISKSGSTRCIAYVLARLPENGSGLAKAHTFARSVNAEETQRRHEYRAYVACNMKLCLELWKCGRVLLVIYAGNYREDHGEVILPATCANLSPTLRWKARAKMSRARDAGSSDIHGADPTHETRIRMLSLSAMHG